MGVYHPVRKELFEDNYGDFIILEKYKNGEIYLNFDTGYVQIDKDIDRLINCLIEMRSKVEEA